MFVGSKNSPNKRIQSDQNASYAFILTADAGRYADKGIHVARRLPSELVSLIRGDGVGTQAPRGPRDDPRNRRA